MVLILDPVPKSSHRYGPRLVAIPFSPKLSVIFDFGFSPGNILTKDGQLWRPKCTIVSESTAPPCCCGQVRRWWRYDRHNKQNPRPRASTKAQRKNAAPRRRRRRRRRRPDELLKNNFGGCATARGGRRGWRRLRRAVTDLGERECSES